MPRFKSGAFELHTTDLNAGAAIKIGGVTDMHVRTGTETMSDGSGDLYDQTRSLEKQIPEAMLTFKSLASVLTYVGLAGYCLSTDGSHLGAKLYGNVLGDCAAPPAATDNIKYTAGKGLLVLGTLTANRGADATISVAVHMITDGTNAPFSGVYSGVTLPTPLLIQQFTLGVCKVGAIVLTDLESVSIDFGVQITEKTPQLGGVWPNTVGVKKITPVVRLNGFNPRVLDDSTGIPLLGKQASHANTLIQLKKRVGYAAFVGDGTAQHIAITVNGMATVDDAFQASANSEATNSIKVEGVHDGTNVPVIFNLASTYLPSP